MNGLYEILTNKKWMMSPDHISSIRKILEQNLASHAAFVSEKKILGRMVNEEGDVVKSYCISEDGDYVGSSWYADEIKCPFVNVIDIAGPITRNGGGCSYGSYHHRDMIMTAADNELCRGHVFVINTPGGSAWAKNDYQQAIEYARSKGQPVIAFIDGFCASAGMYLAALCDERYFMHPEDEIGCIGVMAAFYTEKNGSKNEYTNETYHELYDPESFDKNRWVRDIANDDNDKLLIDELAALGREFRADVKKACPNAKDEHLKGKLFPAKDVTGILMDAQSTLGDVVARVFGLFDGSVEKIERTVVEEDDTEKKQNRETKIETNMEKKNYNVLATACGVSELFVSEEGTHLDVSLCDALTQKLEDDAAAIALANEQQQTIQKQLDELKAEKETALAEREAELKAEYEQSIEALKAEHQNAIQAMVDAHAEDIANADKEKTELQQELSGAKDVLATAEQTIVDRDAQIKELIEKSAETPSVSPASNGTGATANAINTMPAYNDSLSPEENARIRNEWKEKNRV